MFNKVVLCGVVATVLFSMTSCGTQSSSKTISEIDNTDSYYSQTPMSELEYKMYLSEKIALGTGQLNTHMAKLQDVANGSCDIDDEIEDISSSIDLLKEAKENLTYMYPPDSYADIKDRAIEYFQDAIDKLQEASDTLESGITADEATQLSTELKNIFTSMQSLNV